VNELALFAGAGGGILASHMLGWRTVCAVEIDDYARSVLLARQNDGILEPFPIWDDVRTFDGKPWRGFVDVVSGGFPCTDISIAKSLHGRDGINGERSGLWREFLRVVDECLPEYVFGENSPELRNMGLSYIVRELSSRGYVCKWTTIGADDCGLPHKRKRLWFLASNPSFKRLERHNRDGHAEKRWEEEDRPSSDGSIFLCSFCGYQMEIDDRYGCPNCLGGEIGCFDTRPLLQPRITGMDNGVANRMDRLRAIGNGQVPRVAATAFRLLNGNTL
jgi:DNA (cytosine-5)-methyltransferase 1